jgi:hypothetical protein
MMRFVYAALVFCACGGKSGGGGGGGSPDAPGSSIDAPVNVPATITISGTVVEKSTSGSTPVGSATVVAKNSSDDSMVATATTNGSGDFTLTVTTNGQPLDGYLDVTDGSDVETFVYPPAPIGADYTGAPVQMVTQATINELPILTSVTQSPSDALLGLEVVNGSGAPVSGATVTTTPAGSVFYDSSGGLPTKTQKTTNTDGVVFVFNVAPGSVSVMATGSGDTFKTHSITARAAVVTETLITE